eukprot:scaffold1403_cov180-Ochromonas_danica.AAC.2
MGIASPSSSLQRCCGSFTVVTLLVFSSGEQHGAPLFRYVYTKLRNCHLAKLIRYSCQQGGGASFWQ